MFLDIGLCPGLDCWSAPGATPPLPDLPLGNRSLSCWMRSLWQTTLPTHSLTCPGLAFAIDAIPLPLSPNSQMGSALPELFSSLPRQLPDEFLVADADGLPVFWKVGTPLSSPPDLTLPRSAINRLRHPFQLLAIAETVLSREASLPEFRQIAPTASIHPLAVLPEAIRIGANTVIRPGVVIEGPVEIGDNAIIGPNCFIRGHSSIASRAIIGQGCEVKNSLVGPSSAISHLAYAGDSILGNDVNVAAGCVLSNFRHDAGQHFWLSPSGEKVPTGRDKLGAIIGNHSRLGANTTILPARYLPPETQTMPGTIFSSLQTLPSQR